MTINFRLEDDSNKVIVYNKDQYSSILDSHVRYCISSSFSLTEQSDIKIVLECTKCGFEIEYKIK